MSTIEKFEDIGAWQMAKALCLEIYAITAAQNDFSKDYALRDQIRRAAISIVSNIAEDFERRNRKTFIQFLLIAKGSAGEVRAQLHLAFELNYINEKSYSKLISTVTETSRALNGFISYLKKLENNPITT